VECKFKGLFIAALLASSSLVKATPMTEFYPLQVGDDYSYSASGGGVSTTRVKSTSRIAGTKAVGDTTTSPTNFYFTNDASGLRIHGLDVPLLGDFNVSPPIVAAPANPIPGTGTVFQNGTVTGTALCGINRDIPTAINISYSASHRVISAQTNQVIRNEQYPETLTTNFTLSVSGSVPAICGGFINQQISNETTTYARYFGPVKSVVSLPTLSDTFELVGTNIAVLQLVTDTLSVDEDAGVARLGVRKFGSFVGNMSVQCFTDPTGASATVTDDYTAQNSLIEFSSGTGFSVISCAVPIVNDRQVEGDETFGVSISNATSVVAARIAGIEDAVVTIVDNDPEGFVSNDFNADGTSDILLRNTSGASEIRSVSNNSVTSINDVGSLNASYTIQGTGDFNADGTTDILWQRTDGLTFIWSVNNNAQSSFTSLGYMPLGSTIEGTGDFNADGTSDILWRRADGFTVIWSISNNIVTSFAGLGYLPAGSTVGGTGDYNADGTSDILWRRADGLTVIWPISNNARVSFASLGYMPLSFKIEGTGDFNADGTSDILWRKTDGLTVIWSISNNIRTSFASIGFLPVTSTIEGIGDYNADGTSDILWHRADGLTVIWSMDNNTVSSFASLGYLPMALEIQ